MRCAAHPAVQGKGSLAVRPSKLVIGVNHKGALPPGMCAQQVQKAQEAAYLGSCRQPSCCQGTRHNWIHKIFSLTFEAYSSLTAYAGSRPSVILRQLRCFYGREHMLRPQIKV